MKKVTLYKVEEKEIWVADNELDIHWWEPRIKDTSPVVGSDGTELALRAECKTEHLPIQRLSMMLNFDEYELDPYRVEPILDNRYYALTPNAEELMSVMGLYDSKWLIDENTSQKKKIDKLNLKLSLLKSTGFFGRLKMLFTGIKC